MEAQTVAEAVTPLQNETDVPGVYFKSLAHEYIFALVFTDQKVRQNLLHITEDLYRDGEKARIWRNGIAKEIHPDKCNIPNAADATIKIGELYARMVTRDE